MHAIILNGTLKPSPESSSAEALAGVVARALQDRGVADVEHVRLVDHDVKPGVETDMGDGDAWPQIHDRILSADILVSATPTWLGQISSVTKRALERMDAMLSETDDAGVPVAYNKVAGAVVVGNEDGAHACIANIAQALIDIGFTFPGQAWTYWNKGPGRATRCTSRPTRRTGRTRPARRPRTTSSRSPRRCTPTRSLSRRMPEGVGARHGARMNSGK